MVKGQMSDIRSQMPVQKQQVIKIAHLYPQQMNVYGDMGNVITLQYRLTARGYKTHYVAIPKLEMLKDHDVDIMVGGGGQDSNQGVVQADLLKNKQLIHDLVDKGVVGLMICGMYQLFGHRFVLPDESTIAGIGLFDLETKAGEDRLIGNIVTDSAYGQLVGFENHSGRTYLGSTAEPLGKVVKGAGNNGEDGTEGVVFNNVFGSYLHGPLLPKNPAFADELIRRVLEHKGLNTELAPLDDELELQAAKVALQRPR